MGASSSNKPITPWQGSWAQEEEARRAAAAGKSLGLLHPLAPREQGVSLTFVPCCAKPARTLRNTCDNCGRGWWDKHQG
jgi:hypothetical protein